MLSIKITLIIYINDICANELINFQVISTHFLISKKYREKLFGVEMDRRRRGYTSSGDSGMESNLLTHIFLGLSS